MVAWMVVYTYKEIMAFAGVRCCCGDGEMVRIKMSSLPCSGARDTYARAGFRPLDLARFTRLLLLATRARSAARRVTPVAVPLQTPPNGGQCRTSSSHDTAETHAHTHDMAPHTPHETACAARRNSTGAPLLDRSPPSPRHVSPADHLTSRRPRRSSLCAPPHSSYTYRAPPPRVPRPPRHILSPLPACSRRVATRP